MSIHFLKREEKMKKVFSGLFVLVFVLGMALIKVPQIVEADTSSFLAPGEWQVSAPAIGTVVDVTADGAPSYLKLVTNGIKISTSGKICHIFNGANYDYVSEIRQLVDNSWVKIKTTTTLVLTNEESNYTSCAQAKKAGTYAMFAYYHVAESDKVAPGDAEVVEISGLWNRGNVVYPDFTINPSPDWLDVYSTGIKVTSSGELCHPFPASAEKMVAEIRELKDGKWVRIKTTFKNIPAIDGVYSACVKAPEAGTYVVFGYVSK
jgi:hypothetical protein